VFAIEDIIDLAIQIEENGERVYRNASLRISNPSLASLLQWLADEEVKHAKWFSEIKEKVRRTTDDPQLAEMGKRILVGLLGDETFSLKDADFSKMDQIKDLLELAIEFERDTVLFFEMIRSVIEEKQTLDQLEAIIEEETSHIRVLQESLDNGVTENRKNLS
jgi:rubrerythrin